MSFRASLVTSSSTAQPILSVVSEIWQLQFDHLGNTSSVAAHGLAYWLTVIIKLLDVRLKMSKNDRGATNV